MKAKKSLGQHFLHDQSALQIIIDAGEIKPTDTVLEIGPGGGVLTEKLLDVSEKVIAIEKDTELIPILEERFASQITTGKLTIIQQDVLKFDPEIIEGAYKLIANIPYYITGAIIEQFLSAKNQPETMVLLMQKEVAERIISKDKKESILSVAVKAYGNPEYVKTVKAGAFNPQPKVDSAILKIGNISRSQFEDGNEKLFFEILHAGFGQKRKKLIRNIEGKIENIHSENLTSIFNKLGLNENIRAEELNVEQWFTLVSTIR